MCGLKAHRVIEAIELVTAQRDQSARPFLLAPDYETQNVSKKVVRTIHSYIDFVNRTVWNKDV